MELFFHSALVIFVAIIIIGDIAHCASSCGSVCSYIEAYGQATCDDRSLTSIPSQCNEAKYLTIRHNLIEDIEPGSLQHFSSLKFLILSNNRISSVSIF